MSVMYVSKHTDIVLLLWTKDCVRNLTEHLWIVTPKGTLCRILNVVHSPDSKKRKNILIVYCW